MIEYGRRPRIRRMTIVTIRDGRQVLHMLAGRRYSVMTTGSRTRGSRAVIECVRAQCIDSMTIITFAHGLQMLRRLAGRRYTVMATGT